MIPAPASYDVLIDGETVLQVFAGPTRPGKCIEIMSALLACYTSHSLVADCLTHMPA